MSSRSKFVFQIIGDVTKGDTLDPKYFKGIKKVINAVSVIVGPKEGDTPDRQKYSQVSRLLVNSQSHASLSLHWLNWTNLEIK
jgi:hypothetical protein